MALSFFSQSAAPRDFRISSTESDSHYTKCLLCYTIKKNFHCANCIKAGTFVNSTMPYADKFSEKQLKLHRLKANRKYVQERCESILLSKSRKDRLEIDAKQCRDKVFLIRQAIEQRKSSIEEKRKELEALAQYNSELSVKLPRYQKRVSVISKHAQQQQQELLNQTSVYDAHAASLAALRRARIRQLIHYIFPVYVTYDTSESVDEMEFLKVEADSEPVKQARLHVVAPWLPGDGDFSHLQHWMSTSRDSSSMVSESDVVGSPVSRAHAALCFAAQLTSLLAWVLDVRLPYAINFREWCTWRMSCSGVEGRARRLRGCVRACGMRGGQPPARHALLMLPALAAAAAADHAALGSVEGWSMWETCGDAYSGETGAEPDSDNEDEPEHLHWGDQDQMEEAGRSPPLPAPAPSLVTSLASIWRGWTK